VLLVVEEGQVVVVEVMVVSVMVQVKVEWDKIHTHAAK